MGITLGLPLRDIAEARGRSVETVRTQVRSILAKTETHSQSELVRVVLGLMDVALMPAAGGAGPATARRSGAACPARDAGRRTGGGWPGSNSAIRAGGRCLYMHLDFGLIRWPATAERAAAARGVCESSCRCGRAMAGPTCMPRDVDHLAGVTRDYAAVLDHLGVQARWP